MDEILSSHQREYLEKLISRSNITSVSFLPKSKQKDSSTGNTTYVISVLYMCKEVRLKEGEDFGNR